MPADRSFISIIRYFQEGNSAQRLEQKASEILKEVERQKKAKIPPVRFRPSTAVSFQ